MTNTTENVVPYPAGNRLARMGSVPWEATLHIPVELFGTARLRSGMSAVTLELRPRVSRAELVRALALACPGLVGSVIRTDLTGLEDGYALNRSGLAFISMSGTGGEDIALQPGDSILVLSSQAGG